MVKLFCFTRAGAMSFVLQPWQFLLIILAGWVHREQQKIIEFYQLELEAMMKAQEKKRLLLTDDQRRLKAEAGRLLGREDVVPGMIAAIQTHGELLHWHPHLHVLITCGAYTPNGNFLELKEFDLDRLEAAWQEAVFNLYLAEDKIEPEVVENMRSWEHTGFSVDQSVRLPAGDQAGIERFIQYMTRCPFSLSRLVKVTETGQVIYKAEKSSCRSFPEATGDGRQAGPKRNYQIPLTAGLPGGIFAAHSSQGLSSDSLLRLVFQQEPWPAKQAGLRAIRGGVCRASDVCSQQRHVGHADQAGVRAGSVGVPGMWWADEGRGLHRPTANRGDREDLKHCGLWQGSSARPSPPVGDQSHGDREVAACRSPGGPHELTYVDQETFEATF